MTPDSQTQKFVQDLVRSMIRHRKKALSAFFAVMIVTIGAIVWLPRTYYSNSKLFVRLGRESVSLDPTATTGQTMGLVDTREMEINSVLEVLRSRSLAEKVVDRLGVNKVLGRDETAAQEKPGLMRRAYASFGGFFGRLDPVTERERAVTGVEESLAISTPKHTSVIDIGCMAKSPELAQQILVVLLDAFQQEHARLNRTAGSLDFFQTQSVLLRQKLAAAQDQLRKFKDESGLVSIEGQRGMLQQHMATVETDILAMQSSVASGNAKIASIKAELQRLPERVMMEQINGVAHEGSDGMRKALYELEMREAEMKSRFTPEHPQLKEIMAQVADARAIMDKQSKDRTHTTWTINPLRQSLAVDLAKEDVDVASATAHLDSLSQQRAELLAKLKALNDHELKIVVAQRQVDQLEVVYKSYQEKTEQARVDAALAQDRISNVNVAQAPILVARPISPNKPLVLAAGLVLALCAGFGTILAAAHFDQSLVTPHDVESSLETAVLMTLPRAVRQQAMVH